MVFDILWSLSLSRYYRINNFKNMLIGLPSKQAIYDLLLVELPGIEGIGHHIEQLCPVPEKYYLEHPEAPWNIDPSLPPEEYKDTSGNKILWVPYEWVPMVRQPAPDYDNSKYYIKPKLVWYEDRVERQWDVLPIPSLSEAERESWEIQEAARKAEINKKNILYSDYLVLPENFSLSTKEEDQNAFSRLLVLINEAGLEDSELISISDTSSILHEVTVGRLKEILVNYGLDLFNRWVEYKS